MDCSKVGELIARMRKEKGLTQKVMADRLHVSDRFEAGKVARLL